MTGVYDENVEHAIRERLHEHEAAKQAAERRLIAAQNTIEEEDRAIANICFALEDYRKAYGLPPRSDKPSPVLGAEYSHLGPTDLVQYWAGKHGGEVIVKNLARVGIDAGMFPNLRHASSTIYAVLKRKRFEKVGPGHFKKMQTSMQPQEGGGKNIPLPVASSEPIIVSVSQLGTGE